MTFLHRQAPGLLALKEEHQGQGYDGHGKGYADTNPCYCDLGYGSELAGRASGS